MFGNKKLRPFVRFSRKRPFAKSISKSLDRRTEFKTTESISSIAFDSASPTVTLLNGVVPGLDDDQRIGRKITLRSLQTLGTIFNGSSGVDQVVRIAVVLDKTPGGVLPSYSNIFSSSGVDSMRNLDFRSRFQILSDQHIVVNTKGQYGDAHPVQSYRKMFTPTIYNAGVAGTVADIESGALYLVTQGNVTGANVFATLSIAHRVRYIDN